MSRIGKQPIVIPDNVEVSIQGDTISIKGSKGTQSFEIPFDFAVEKKEKELVVTMKRDSLQTRKMWGTVRALIANLITGVHAGFEKKLELDGVGYRVNLQGKDLEMQLGFSHPVKFPAPAGIEFKVEKNAVTVSGISKDLVGRTAASIRALKKPEPYKGKGFHYAGEVIRRKAGKKASATG